MKISACMIVKNEETNIEQCINSYREVVDEIIVVDTGSTDRTVDIATRLGANIYHFEWVNDFSKAKNYAISKATGNWIIFLDADEYFDYEKALSIPALINKHGIGKTEILACKMYNIDEATGNNLADFVQTRIFKNTGNIHYVNAIHERLNSKSKNIHAVYIEENDLVIYHTGYSEDRIISKAERNLQLLLLELEKPKFDPSMYHFLSDTYLTLKDYEKSIEYGKMFLKNPVKLEGLNNKVYQNLITAMVEKRYPWGEVYKVIEEAITEFPDHPMFQMYLARAHHFTKRYEKALESYLKTIELQNRYDGIDINFITGKIHEIETPIASIYVDMNKEDKAINYYIRALERKKDYLPALQGLIKLIGKFDTVESETISIFNRLYDRKNEDDIKILVEELTKQRSGKLLAYYVSLLNKEFGFQDFSMVMMLLANGKYDEAYKHFWKAYHISHDDTYARLAFVAGLLNEDQKALSELKNQINTSLERVIEGLISTTDDVVLYKEDAKEYFDVLNEIIKLRKHDYFDCFINLKEKFTDDILGIETAIGNLFKVEGYYDKAVEMYMESIKICQVNEQQKKELKSLYFMIGYCYYKCKSMQQALEYFDVAIETGYLENDIREFVTWIIDQTEDGELKGHAQKLIDQFDNEKLHVLE